MSDLISTFSTLQQKRRSPAVRRKLRLVDSADDPTDLFPALRQMDLLASGDLPRVTTLASSATTHVYRVDLGWGPVCVKRALLNGSGNVQALALERVSAEIGWFKVACGVAPGVAPAVLGSLPGVGVFAMEYLEPDEFPSWQSRIASGRLEPWAAAELGHLVGRLHAASAHSAVVRERFSARTAFKTLALAPRLQQAASAHAGSGPALARLEESMAATHVALVHGALSPDNLLLGPRGPVLIDADCAHSGDPMFDVATCLGALAVRMVGHSQRRAELVSAYDAFYRSYFAHVTWEMSERAEARAAALMPALLLADFAADAIGADRRRQCANAYAMLSDPSRRLDDLCIRWLEALD